MNRNELLDVLKLHNQNHLIDRVNQMNETELNEFIKQVKSIDWNAIENIHESYVDSNKVISPLDAVEISDIKKHSDEYYEVGIKAIQSKKVACVLLAGGQGTRLGLDKPKGTLNVGIHKDLYLFEQLINNTLKVVNDAGTYIPLYIMTSDKNHEDTVSFFKEHHYFGYDSKYIKFFKQNMVPSVDFEGKLLMESRTSLTMSPNGNGGWFASMLSNGFREELSNFDWINIFAVDNILQKIADPVFIGATILAGCECGSKVVRKVNANERVGVMCKVNGHPSIIEYYDMPEELANETRNDGELTYGFGVILNYLFKTDKLFKIVDNELPMHIAKKKIPYINDNDEIIKPEEPNGYKFETLVLDMVEMMDNCIPFEVVREHEFAPIKNKTGQDSLESARELLKINGIEF